MSKVAATTTCCESAVIGLYPLGLECVSQMGGVVGGVCDQIAAVMETPPPPHSPETPSPPPFVMAPLKQHMERLLRGHNPPGYHPSKLPMRIASCQTSYLLARGTSQRLVRAHTHTRLFYFTTDSLHLLARCSACKKRALSAETQTPAAPVRGPTPPPPPLPLHIPR